MGLWKKKVDVFISYRRKGGRDLARNLYDRLTLRGFSVFFDFESMRDGPFNTQIYKAIEQASDFILVLSESAMTNCSKEDDWVRKEVEYALSLNKHIVTVCPEDTFSGWPDDLPESLWPIRDPDIYFLHQRHYDEDINDLIRPLHANARRRSRFYGRLALAVVAIGLGFYVFHTYRGDDDATDTSRITAHCYLTRYKDLSLFDGISYGEEELKAFHYEDTLDGPDYIVYPLSDHYLLRAHHAIRPMSEEGIRTPYPVFTLRIINKSRQTAVVNSASVEVRKIVPAFESPVHIVGSNEGFLIHGVSGNTCRIAYDIVDTRTGKSVGQENDILCAEAGAVLFDFRMESPTDRMLIGTIEDAAGLIPFIIPTDASMTAPDDHDEESLPHVEFSTRKGDQTLPVISFDDRNLVKGETDDRFHFSVCPDESCSFEMRVILRTIDKKTYHSDWIRVSVFKS